MNVLITGATGQDGSLLSDLHIQQGHKVWGTISSFRQSHGEYNFELINASLVDKDLSRRILDEIMPDRIYHMAAVHNSSTSNLTPSDEIRMRMYECHVQMTKNFLDWQVLNSKCRLVVALSSQMYSPQARTTVISEDSQVSPRNYYAETKVEAMKLLQGYRKRHQLYAYGAILFNHTSLRSKSDFLFPQLARALAAFARGETQKVSLEDATALIDISHAYEVCSGLYKLLSTNDPEEIIFSSGNLVEVSEIILRTICHLKIDRNIQIESRNSKGLNGKYVVGNNYRARQKLGWRPIMTPAEILAEQVINELNK